MKSVVLFYSFLNRERQAYVLTSLKDFIFITRSITVQLKFLSLNGKLYVCDNRLLVFVNFSFLTGVICMIEAKNTKKTK